MTAPDQTNAEVSDERLREALQKFIDHYPSGINPALDEAYRLGRDALTRRSATSQASEEPVAYRYVPKEQRGTDDFIWRFASHHPGDGKWKVEPLYTSLSKRVERLETATHRHVKRGSEYVLISYGKMQAERWLIGDTLACSVDSYTVAEIKAKLGVDMREVAIYRSVDDGSLWVRPREEFEDGRFQALQGDRS